MPMLMNDPASPLSADLLRRACDTFTDPIFIKDRQHRFIAGNAAFFALFGLPAEKVLGKSDPDFFPPAQVEQFWRNDDALFTSARPSENEEQLTDGNGAVRTIWTRKYPLFDGDGNVQALSGIITDVTKIRGALERSVRLEAEVAEQQRIIQAQSQLLGQLAVPVITLWEGIALLPIIGEITRARAQQILESLLEAITRSRAQFAILDITGVPVVDAAVAGYLLQSTQAARLLGCQTIMVGIGPGVAAQLARLNADFSSVSTQASLQQGLEFALARLSFVVRRAR